MTQPPEDEGRGRRGRSGRRRWSLVAAVVLLLAGAATAWLVGRAVAARGHLEEARVQLETARAALLDRRLGDASGAIRSAGVETAAARAATGDPLWRLLATVPFLGNSLQVSRGLAAGTDDIARQVLPAALAAAEDLDPKAVRRPDGSIDLALLRRVGPGIRSSAERARQVDERMRALDGNGLLPQVESGRDEVLTASEGLRSALESGSAAVEVAPALLGADRGRRYLVIVQQTSESRGTGGLPGGFAELEARAGRLLVRAQGSNAELRNGPVQAPAGVPADWVRRYRGQGALDIWQNVNLSPDLPVVARVIEARWRAQGGRDLDGVITVDAKALATLLKGSGPVQLGAGQELPPEELEDYLAVGQYEGVDIAPGSLRLRKERLDLVAGAVLGRLTGGGGDSVALLRGLSTAVRSGHLRMASDDRALEPLLRRTGVDGALPRGDAPVAYPVVFNATGGKLDYFLDRRVRYEAGGCGERRRGSVITTTLTSQVPSGPLPPYLTIRLDNGRLEASRVNRLGLIVYGTRGSRLRAAALDGKPLSSLPGRSETLLEQGQEAGLPLWQVYLDLPPGQPRELVLELDEPVVRGQPRLPEQPLARSLVRSMDAPICP